jgi:hypothetical protein
MHDGVDVGSRLVDLPVNEPLEVEAATAGIDGGAVQIEFQDIGRRH